MKKMFLAAAIFSVFASTSFTQKTTMLNKDSNFLEVFMAFPEEWLASLYSWFHLGSSGYNNTGDFVGVSERERYFVLDHGGTVIDYKNYSMVTYFPCDSWGGVTLNEIRKDPQKAPMDTNCINTAEFAVWKSDMGSLFVGTLETEGFLTPNRRQSEALAPPIISMYEYKYNTNKWQEVLDFPNNYKQLLVLLKKKYPFITKKKYEFRYVLPARGNVIRAVVQWTDTGDYKMPQLLDLAYIKLSNGKWFFVPL